MKLRRLLIWPLVLALVGGSVWGGLRLLRSRGEAGTETDLTQVVAVERGDLVASISPTGEVVAPRQALLGFDVNRLPVVELNAVAGQTVHEGDLLARVDPASLERAVEQAEAALLTADEELQAARNPYTELDRHRAGLSVRLAETALEEARQRRQDLDDPDLDAAAKAVQSAAERLKQARADLEELESSSTAQAQIDRLQWLANEAEAAHGRLVEKAGSSEEDLDRERLAYNRWMDALDDLEAARLQTELSLRLARYQVFQAEDALADAKEALAELKAGPTALARAQADNQVAQAEYNLTKAREDLADILAGPDPGQIQIAQSRLTAAQAALEEAQAALGAATLFAPFDGTVISVGAEAGDLVSSGLIVVALADLTQLQVRATVDETEISQVSVGQEVEITFDAFPGRLLHGKVLEVPLEGRLRQNVVTYEVPVSLEGSEGVALKSGMTANLKIVVGKREGVLLIPALAVQLGDAGNVVMVQETPGAAAVETPVEVGLSDGMYVEVLRGLIEGDQVEVHYQAQEEPTFFGAMRFERAMEVSGPNGGPPPGGAVIVGP